LLEKLEPTAGLEPATYGLRKSLELQSNRAAQRSEAVESSRTYFADASDASNAMPPVTAELFIKAAAIAALRASFGGAELLQRGLDQAAALHDASAIPRRLSAYGSRQ